MSAQPPCLILTRTLPAAVEARANSQYRIVRSADQPQHGDDLAALARAVDADGLLITAGDRLTAATIAALPDTVRIIATFSVGYDHIDIAAARTRGIVVTNTPDVLTDATADIALLLILAACRRASEGEQLVRADGWTGWTPTQMLGLHLGGRRLGIYGMGRIGQAVAARARAFGLRIHYHNRRRLAPELEQGAIFHANPNDLVAQADILSLHAPSSPDTHHFLNADRIALLPTDPVVINTARGGLVDDDALIAALASGRVWAAGLDVFNNEPHLDPRYRTLRNVFLLPHLGSATVETRNAMGFKALDNLDAWFAQRPVPDPVV